MIGSDLESAGLESRAASGAASASSDDAAAVRAVIEASTSRCRSSQEGAAPASSESATRIRVRSASAGVAGAVRVPALGALALLAVTAPAHRCPEGNVNAGPAI